MDPILLAKLAHERQDLWPLIERHPCFEDLSDSLRKRICAREPLGRRWAYGDGQENK